LRDISKAIMAVFTQPEERVCAEVFTVGDYSQQFTKRMIVGEVQNGLGGMQIEYRPEIH
jgi:hypothetical protein